MVRAKRRRYSDEERANAVAAVKANRGNVQGTAKALGIPEKTLEHWVKSYRHPEAAKQGEEKRGPMADALEKVAWKLLDSIEDKIEAAPLSQAATAMGIAIDKARLLREQPTDITEQRDRQEIHVTFAVAPCASTDDSGLPETSRFPAIAGAVPGVLRGPGGGQVEGGGD